MEKVITSDIEKRLKQKNKNIEKYLDTNDIDAILLELDVFESELIAQNEELIQNENRLLEAKEEYEILFDNSPISYLVLDSKYNIVKYNQVADSYFEISKSFINQKSFFSYLQNSALNNFTTFIENENSSFIENSFDILLPKQNKYSKFKIHKNILQKNSIKEYFISLTNIQDEYDNLHTIEKLHNEQVKNKELILKQSRAAGIGEMLGNIAHQWRQPLNIISLVATQIQTRIELNTRISKSDLLGTITQINDQVQYLSKTIDDFRYFFTSDLEDFEEVNIKDTFIKVHNLIKGSFDNNFIEIHSSLNDLKINLNENQLIQALINIYNNSKDAILSNKNEERLFFVNAIKKDDYIIISLRDSGGGIDENIKDKVFDPYFTTKHKSQGTGVGLYMTYQIITKNLGGSISIENCKYTYNEKEIKGANTIIKLPCK